MPLFGFGQAAVHLNCIKTLQTGDILLNWNVPNTPCPTGCFVSYDVYVSSTGKGGPYNLLTSINNAATTTYTHVGANGQNNKKIFYFIQTVCNCGAGNIVANSDTANDELKIPKINYITVNGNVVVMNWQPSTSSQTYAYQIYYFAAGSYHPLDTVKGYNTVLFTDSTFNPNTQSVTFTIGSIDSCGSKYVFNDTTPQHTIYLQSTVDRCNQTISLNWNAYTNWRGGVDRYYVYVKLNHDTFKIAKTLTPIELSTFLSGYKDGDTVQIYVQANEGSGYNYVSKSNLITLIINVVQPPLYTLLQNCTVINNQDIKLQIVLDAMADIKAYSIYRSSDNINYSLLNTVAITSPVTSSVINFIDNTADVKHSKYYYKVFSVDSCSRNYEGAKANSILLTGYVDNLNVSQLSWNKIKIDSAIVNGYTILRSNNAWQSFIVVGGVSSTDSTSWADGLRDLYASQDSFEYRIQAQFGFKNALLGTINLSYSNDLVIHPNSEIFIPNAIFPKGKNNVFKPIITFPDILNYNLVIFNRLGEKIFTSDSYNTGWDGTFGGNEVPQGNYTYQITFEKPDGKKFVKQGNCVVVY
jgi:gliding motility-associated-like protein